MQAEIATYLSETGNRPEEIQNLTLVEVVELGRSGLRSTVVWNNCVSRVGLAVDSSKCKIVVGLSGSHGE